MSERVMIVTTVPFAHLEAVLDAIGHAGAGVLGNYSHCAWVTAGTGRFRANEQANPAYGKAGEASEIGEFRIETWCERDQAKRVIAALRTAHPYEEPVYYILPLLSDAEL
jgi:hypothetical protein